MGRLKIKPLQNTCNSFQNDEISFFGHIHDLANKYTKKNDTCLEAIILVLMQTVSKKNMYDIVMKILWSYE